jgi:hypothetical protein
MNSKEIYFISPELIRNKKQMPLRDNSFKGIPLNAIIKDVLDCYGITNTCCSADPSAWLNGAFIKKQYKAPKNWVSLDNIILDVYNCCKSTTFCGKDTKYWIDGAYISKENTQNSLLNLTKIVRTQMRCCIQSTSIPGVLQTFTKQVTIDFSSPVSINHIISDTVNQPAKLKKIYFLESAIMSGASSVTFDLGYNSTNPADRYAIGLGITSNSNYVDTPTGIFLRYNTGNPIGTSVNVNLISRNLNYGESGNGYYLNFRLVNSLLSQALPTAGVLTVTFEYEGTTPAINTPGFTCC